MPKTKKSAKRPTRSVRTSKNSPLSLRRLSRRTSYFIVAALFALVGAGAIVSSRAATVELPNQWGKYYNATGPTPGVELKPSSGVYVSKDGTVIENLEVRGGIWIEANNVTIKNVRLLGTAANGIFQAQGKSGLVMDRIEIIGQYKDGAVIDAYDNAIYGEEGWTLRNSRISGYPDGAKLHKNTLVENNYFFDNSRTFNSAGKDKHVDGMQSMGGSNVIIRNNTFIADNRPGGNYDMASNLMIQNDKSQVVGYTIENNRFSGGAFSIQLNSFKTNAGPHKNVVVRNNTFAGLAPKGYSQYGPIRIGVPTDDITVTGNVFADDSGVITKIADRQGSGTGADPGTGTPVPETEPVVDPPATPPATVTLKGLTPNQPVSGSVALEAIPANTPNLAGIDFYLDGKLINSQKTAPICLFDDNGKVCTPYDISKVTPNGNHTFKAVARYGANQTVEASVTVNVQNSTTSTPAPDTTPPTPPANLTRSLRVDYTKFRYVLDLRWTASQDASGIKEYRVSRNGTLLGKTGSNVTRYTDSTITDGPTYSYTVTAVDNATTPNVSLPSATTAKVNCFMIWCSLQ